MNNCIRCKFYDSSVDCCNADENCYQVGYQKGRAEMAHKLKFIIELLEGNNSTMDIIKEILEKEDKQ